MPCFPNNNILVKELLRDKNGMNKNPLIRPYVFGWGRMAWSVTPEDDELDSTWPGPKERITAYIE